MKFYKKNISDKLINSFKIVYFRILETVSNNALKRSVYATFQRYIHKPLLNVVSLYTNIKLRKHYVAIKSLTNSITYKDYSLVILTLKINFDDFLSANIYRAKMLKNSFKKNIYSIYFNCKIIVFFRNCNLVIYE